MKNIPFRQTKPLIKGLTKSEMELKLCALVNTMNYLGIFYDIDAVQIYKNYEKLYNYWIRNAVKKVLFNEILKVQNNFERKIKEGDQVLINNWKRFKVENRL